MALPRVKVVPPMEARMEGAERMAERRAPERKRVAAIVVCDCLCRWVSVVLRVGRCC